MDPRPDDRDEALLRIAASISDREPVTWEPGAEPPPGGSRGIAGLRSLEALARVFAGAPPTDTGPGPILGPREAWHAHDPGAAYADLGMPASWGPLRLLEVLGRGGFGNVYRAYDPRLDREVALKLWRRDRAHDPEAMLAEARALARLRHPGLPAVHGVDEHDGRLGMWTELVRGRTLEQVLETDGPLDAREAARVGLEICRTLAAVHAAGLVHRDVKTDNVLREPDGRVVLVDFGLAFHAGGSLMAGRGAGTPPSMAPELLRGERATVRSDLYALGVLLYRLVTRAFPRPEDAAAPDATATPAIVPLRGRRPDLSEAFARLVERALAESPDDRYPDTTEFERALVGYLGPGAPETRPTAAFAVEAPHAGRLPRPWSGFVGRERELWECRERLRSSRLVTVVGPGGAGKTRLALRLAELTARADGVAPAFADLSVVTGVEALDAAVLEAFGMPPGGAGATPRRLADALAGQPALLVVDPCEHLLPGLAGRVRELLEACPSLLVLATSRNPLGIEGESLCALAGMETPAAGTPTSPDAASGFDAVRLFVERARQVHAGFRLTGSNVGVVADLCRRLDGLPLAIELAATRMRVLTVEEIHDRLDQGLRLLARPDAGPPGRHDTLAGTIRWSYDALPEERRRFFDALAVFAGGWTLAAAARVGLGGDDELEALDAMTHLVDHSMAVTDAPRAGASRFRFLETLHQFARERLAASGALDDARRRHFDFFLAFAGEAERGLWGPRQAEWVERVDADHANLLAALDGARDQAGRAGDALRMAAALVRFWTDRGHLALGRRVLGECLARVAPGAHDDARAGGLTAAGMLATYQSDHDEAQRCCDEALALHRALGDATGSARTLAILGVLAHDRADYAAARAWYRDALAIHRETGDRGGVARVLNNLGAMAWREGAWSEAHALASEALEHATAVGDVGVRVVALANLGLIEVHRGRFREAAVSAGLGLEAVLEHRVLRHAPAMLETAAALLARHAHSARAARLYAAADRQRERVGLSSGGAWHAAHAPLREFIERDLGPERLAVERAAGRAFELPAAVDDARFGLATLAGERG